MHCQSKGILLGVRPVDFCSHCLANHAVNQHRQQPGNVARQTSLYTLPLYPNVLDSIVQTVHVLTAIMGTEVGVAAVQQLMHHKPDIPLQHRLVNDGVSSDIFEDDAARVANGSSGHVGRPLDSHRAQTQSRAELVASSLNGLM
jgi:hypothetical protein